MTSHALRRKRVSTTRNYIPPIPRSRLQHSAQVQLGEEPVTHTLVSVRADLQFPLPPVGPASSRQSTPVKDAGRSPPTDQGDIGPSRAGSIRRWQSVALIAGRLDIAALPALRQAAEDPDPFVRAAARDALRKIDAK